MNAKRALVAGLIATAVMTGLWLVELKVGWDRMAAGDMLSSLLAVVIAYTSVGPVLGWAIHFVFGMVLAVVYAAAFVGRLPGNPIARGAIYGCLVFLIAQLVFMPLVGAGVFSKGDVPVLIGSLIGHLVYGGLVGAIYGAAAAAGPMPPLPAA